MFSGREKGMKPFDECQHTQLRERYSKLVDAESAHANYGDRCPDCGWLVSAAYAPGQGGRLYVCYNRDCSRGW